MGATQFNLVKPTETELNELKLVENPGQPRKTQ